MDTRKNPPNFSEFIRNELKQYSNDDKPNLINTSNDCQQIYNGCLTRLILISQRLNDILKEYKLPPFEDIVNNLRKNNNDNDNIKNDNNLNKNIGNLNRMEYDNEYPIRNCEFLLKELLIYTSKFINIDDRFAHQEIIEQAAVYILWVIFDSFYINSEKKSENFSNLAPHYLNLEYIFCLEMLNYMLLEKLNFLSKSIFELMEMTYLNKIFLYPSAIKKAILNIENNEPNYDWIKLFTEDYIQNEILGDFIDPFEITDHEYMLLNDVDINMVKETTEDLSKFNFNYSNSEIILQSLFYTDPFLFNEFKTINLNIMDEKLKNCNLIENKMKIDMPDESQKKLPEEVLSDLYDDLSNFIIDYNSQHEGQEFYLSNEELYNAILNLLINTVNEHEIIDELTNLLGTECHQLITKITSFYKKQIKTNSIATGVPNLSSKLKAKKVENLFDKISQVRDTGSGMIRPSIVIQTDREKELKKERRKINKKINKEMNKRQKIDETNECSNENLSLKDLERMRHQNIKESVRAALMPSIKKQLEQYKPTEKYPFVFDLYQSIKTTAAYMVDTKLMLPVGTERKVFETYDEVLVPIIAPSGETKNFLETFKIIEIKDTDEFVQKAFQGFSKLNIIQSTVFQTAYQLGNQNMLICAPTGAGKTNIAMLTILNIIRSFSADQFKIIYIAPMKALCAEMTASFSKRLQPFGIKVRELTGDMQMTSKEIMETQMLVVTPEKWDVVTRKSVGDVQLMDLVRLIVIDEIHLLESDRGHVLETLVARTIRYFEQTQSYIRLVGLSATLPNYIDVSQFLGVDPYKGLFVFDERFRPVPLLKRFIGCKAQNKQQLINDMDEISFMKAKEILRKEQQVMIFVHSRNATMALANFILEKSQTDKSNDNIRSIFEADTIKLHGSEKLIAKARYRNLNKFLMNGIGLHHAGMPRSERNIVEKLFSHGVIKVLVCTSTLAWGVNLPARSVIIRGTDYYDPCQGHFVDITMLDVLQIFGRAGRPQFDNEGEATIITPYAKLPHYLNLLTNQLPIESHFLKRLTDNLNSEIVLGTISNIAEAVEWLKYTYLYIRMQKNPLEYGLKMNDAQLLIDHLYRLAKNSAELLDKARMIRYYPENEGTLDATHLGQVASHFYIQHETIIHFNEQLKPMMDIGEIFEMMAHISEFQQLRCREEEIEHLEKLRQKCPYRHLGELTNTHTKVFILMQSVVNCAITDCHSLFSDMMYIHQNMSRLTRGMFDFVLRQGWPSLAEKFLSISLMFEKQIWDFDTPLHQFKSEFGDSPDVLQKLSALHQRGYSNYHLKEMDSNEIGDLVRHKKYGPIIKRLINIIPNVTIEATVKPITKTILTIYLDVKPDFIWDDKYHGKSAQLYWLWVTDTENNNIYHSQLCNFTKKQVKNEDIQHYVFTIPLLDPSKLQKQYLIHSTFEYWIGSINETPVSCHDIVLPDFDLPATKLLDLTPLPVEALQNEKFQSIYSFTHFNPIQTQIFHTLYHTDNNVLLGAPTGSGKTIAAEIALFRVYNTNPNGKIVYIAPLKALVRERVDDWRKKIEKKIQLKVVELTGDVTPDIATIDSSNVIVTTPEKWDGVSRGWNFRKFVREVALIIIDEIHLLGEERGPVLEMIVSRTNFICRRTGNNIRIIGLSTAVANAQDLSAWLNIKNAGLYNFSSSVRPVPIEVHVSGFSGKHYCPRMASMNKPAYRAIKQYSLEKPVIIFVSSRRQTRLTAFDLITLIARDSGQLSFLHVEDAEEFESILESVKDSNLKQTLSFGIGMHHAGLIEDDRKLVEQLFSAQKIQVLVTTATLAWGINLPAHAVIIKGTEFFDGKQGRYVDFPITDVLQMIGRAGRPQFDTSAVAILFVHDIKKEYYRKFLYEPFPVESHLLDVFPDHLNAEIVSGTVKTKHEAMEFLSSTYLYHRIIKNCSYYGVDLSSLTNKQDELMINTEVIKFLSAYIDNCVQILLDNYCISVRNIDNESGQNILLNDSDFSNCTQTLCSTPLGKISSYYYLSYKTIKLFQDKLSNINNIECNDGQFVNLKIDEILDLLTQSQEYATLPVRHNEEFMNLDLSKSCPINMDRRSMDSPHTKANLLLQAHCSRIQLPIVDYYTDLKSVLDQVLRIMQAMIDISSLNGSLSTTINIINLQQCIIQASWQHTNQLFTLLETNKNSEFVDNDLNDATEFYSAINCQNQIDSSGLNIGQLPPELSSIPVLLHFIYKNRSEKIFKELFFGYRIHNRYIKKIYNALINFPLINFENITIKSTNANIENESNEQDEMMDVCLEDTFKSRKEVRWIEVKSNTEYHICCQLRRMKMNSNTSGNSGNPRAFAPNFPKPKSESWYLILGDQENSELITMTRVPYINYNSTYVNIKFKTPSISGTDKFIFYTIYLFSDSYIGLDQQYILPLKINLSSNGLS